MERLAANPSGPALEILVDRATQDPEAVVRGVAVEGLRSRAAETARTAVKKALDDDAPVVRRAACVVAISVLGEKDGKRLLTRLKNKDADPSVRGIAAQCLK